MADEDTVKQFRKRIADVLHRTPYSSDDQLRHWLTARNNDLRAAEEMFRKSMDWRCEFKVNAIQSWTAPDLIKKYFPHGSCGTDRMGHRVYIFNMGSLDMRGLMRCVKRTDLVNFGIQILETFKMDSNSQSEKMGKYIGRSGVIVDLQHLQLAQITNRPGLDMILQWIQGMEANYPDTLEWCYVINVPTIFSIAWVLISPLLHEVTRSKVKLFTPGTWQGEVLKLVDPAHLPAYWGGTLTDPDGDPKCPELISFAGAVPIHLHTPADQLRQLQQMLPQQLELKAGSTSRQQLTVTAPGTIIRYQFVTRDADIDFALLRCTDDVTESLVARQKVFSHLVPEEGHVVCTEPGIYCLEFDNTASYFKRKQVFFRFTVETT